MDWIVMGIGMVVAGVFNPVLTYLSTLVGSWNCLMEAGVTGCWDGKEEGGREKGKWGNGKLRGSTHWRGEEGPSFRRRSWSII